MKSLTFVVVVFCSVYYVQNSSLPGLDSIGKLSRNFGALNLVGNASSKSNNSTPSSNSSNKRPILTGTTGKRNASDPDQVCYPPLGCFNKTYHAESNLPGLGYFLPSNPEELDITIIHFSNLNTKGQKLHFNSSRIDQFLKNQRSYFIIHGWQTEFSYESWLDDLKDTILRVNNGSANVFVVDWSKFASSILYPVSAENTKLVGRAIGYFIMNTLKKNYGVNCDDIQVFGHSLGGQTAGFVGKFCNAQNCHLKRIIALDAAGPFFRSTDKNERVCAGDARYVEAIHTNAAPIVLGGLGTTQKSGDVDFWPNGGTTQTGCNLRDKLGEIVKDGIDLDAPSCSHGRAPEIYATNYDRLAHCQLVGYQCKDYETFKKGKCGCCGADNSKCRLIGLSKYHDPTTIPLPKTDEDFYVETTEESPYCLHTYQVKVKTSQNITGAAIGSFYLNLIGIKRDAKDIQISGPATGFEKNKTYTALLQKELPLEELQKVEMYFDDSILGRVVGLASTVVVGVDEIQVNYMSHIDPAVRKQNSGKFMPEKANGKLSNSSKKRTVFVLSKRKGPYNCK